MALRLFIVAAIVLTVFGIIASAHTNLQLWGVWWFSWFLGAFLSFLVDIALNVYYVTGRGTTRTGPPV